MSDVRVRKLQEFIKQEVSQMLMRGLKDPRIGFTTITDVHEPVIYERLQFTFPCLVPIRKKKILLSL